jgi:hypothetical protein
LKLPEKLHQTLKNDADLPENRDELSWMSVFPDAAAQKTFITGSHSGHDLFENAPIAKPLNVL